MNKRFILLMVLCVLVISGCGGDDETPATQASVQENSPVLVSDSAGGVSAATAFFLQQQITPTTRPAATATPDVPLDPGPYLTPNRARPENPRQFDPPETVGDFTIFQNTGDCHRDAGLNIGYQSSDGEIVYFFCHFMSSTTKAQAAIADVPATALTGEPIFLALQPNHSFAMGVSGNGFLFAWVNGPWYFVARSLNGREPLDQFMESFPY